MTAKSDYLKTQILNHMANNIAYSSPTAMYLAAYTVAPTDAGGGTEVSGGAYVRQAVSWGAESGGQVVNDADVIFPTATASWGTVLHYGLFDAASGGNLLYHTPLGASQAIGIGDILRVPTGQLTLSES